MSRGRQAAAGPRRATSASSSTPCGGLVPQLAEALDDRATRERQQAGRPRRAARRARPPTAAARGSRAPRCSQPTNGREQHREQQRDRDRDDDDLEHAERARAAPRAPAPMSSSRHDHAGRAAHRRRDGVRPAQAAGGSDPARRRGAAGCVRCAHASRPAARACVEVGEQVGDVLDADREPHEVVGHLERGAGDRPVRHPRGVLDQRLDAAERLREREHAGRARTPSSADASLPGPERDHAAEPAHLPGGDLVPGVARAGPGRSPAVTRGVRRRGSRATARGVGAVPVHPHGERLAARAGSATRRTGRRPRRTRSGGSRRRRRAHVVPVGPSSPTGQLRAVGDDERAADDVASARRCTWSSSARRRRRRARAAAAGTASRTCCRRRAAHPAARACAASAAMSAMPSSGLVGVSTQTTLVRPGLDRGEHRVGVGQVDRRVLDAPRPEHARDQAVRAAVRVVRAPRRGRPGAGSRAAACPRRRGPTRTRSPPHRPRPRASASSSAVRVGLPEREYSYPPRRPPTPSCL